MNLHILRAIRLISARQLGLPVADFLSALDDSDLSNAFTELLSRRGRAAARSAAVTVANGMSAEVAAGCILTPHAMTPYVLASSTAMSAVAASGPTVTTLAASTTAVAALVASSTAMTALAASNTAMTALAASTTAMTAIAASSLAMGAVAASTVAMTAIAASSVAMRAVIASRTALTAVFSVPAAKSKFSATPALAKASIPKMTSNTTPSGVASASSDAGAGYDPWLVFDQSDVTFWNSLDTPGGNWIQYKFSGEIFVSSITLTPAGDPAYAPKECVLQCSTDGISFAPAKAISAAYSGTQVFEVINPGFYKYWRFFVSEAHSATPYVQISSMGVTGFIKP